jgi:hypothetical protein
VSVLSTAAASGGLPMPKDLAPETVARISDVPTRDGIITRSELRHQLVIAEVAEGKRSASDPSAGEHDRLMHKTVDGLIETVWIKGQATEMHIVVTKHRVSREVSRLKQSFATTGEYRALRKSAPYTPRDVYASVESQVLSNHILERIAAGARSKAEENDAIEEFVTQFNERWRGRTVCAPRYTADNCSNGSP